ncbi:MAG TPA: ion channel [Telluria sp.]|nr:ion channel [Telluria sp.]
MKPAYLSPATLLSGLILAIPAFYLVLTGPTPAYRQGGSWLYGLIALLVALQLFTGRRANSRIDWTSAMDLAILGGALASAWPSGQGWSDLEWALRLGYCGIVFIRLATVVAPYVVPRGLLQMVILAAFLMAVAGLGFLWLEPRVHSYADGLWLAFITGATVGYGDLVPSTPASRVFAAFIVLLGYALFSVVTASIAALLVGEDEKRLRHALHADLRLLRNDIASLRIGLNLPADREKG